MKTTTFFLTMAALIPAHAAAADEVQAGQALFASRCASCHAVGPTARARFGPQLNGLLGRPAGSTGDYRYSPAMKNAGIVWTEQTLRQFLQAPGDTVPGNKMRFWGMRDDRQIDRLLAYLKTFS